MGVALALALARPLTVILALTLELGVREGEAELDGHGDALPLRLGDVEAEGLGETTVDAVGAGLLATGEGLRAVDALALGEREADMQALSEGAGEGVVLPRGEVLGEVDREAAMEPVPVSVAAGELARGETLRRGEEEVEGDLLALLQALREGRAVGLAVPLWLTLAEGVVVGEEEGDRERRGEALALEGRLGVPELLLEAAAVVTAGEGEGVGAAERLPTGVAEALAQGEELTHCEEEGVEKGDALADRVLLGHWDALRELAEELLGRGEAESVEGGVGDGSPEGDVEKRAEAEGREVPMGDAVGVVDADAQELALVEALAEALPAPRDGLPLPVSVLVGDPVAFTEAEAPADGLVVCKGEALPEAGKVGAPEALGEAPCEAEAMTDAVPTADAAGLCVPLRDALPLGVRESTPLADAPGALAVAMPVVA